MIWGTTRTWNLNDDFIKGVIFFLSRNLLCNEIYEIINVKNVRDNISREVLKFIIENYKTLLFAKRWLLKKLPEFKVNFALRTLEREGILQHHNQLPEKSNGIVSQAEHTLLIDDEVVVLTKWVRKYFIRAAFLNLIYFW